MSTLLLTETTKAGCVVPRRARVRDRMWSRLGAWGLDQALAEGACPDAGARLSLRAHRLIGIEARDDLAREVRHILRDLRRRPSRFDRGAVRWQRAVADAAALLEKLAARLASEGPVEATGVARVRILLRDGAGPLYVPRDPRHLTAALQWALDGLDMSGACERLGTSGLADGLDIEEC